MSQIFFGLIVMMERSPVVLQELSAADLITDLFVKIFPAPAEFWAISQYSGGSALIEDKFFPELSDK